jgi:hypothetical protein
MMTSSGIAILRRTANISRMASGSASPRDGLADRMASRMMGEHIVGSELSMLRRRSELSAGSIREE